MFSALVRVKESYSAETEVVNLDADWPFIELLVTRLGTQVTVDTTGGEIFDF